MVLLDTCAIIEACQQNPSFSSKVFKQIDSGAYVLSISFAEIACKIKMGKLEMGITPDELFQEYRKIKSIEIIDIGVSEWLSSIKLDWAENRDPADRLMVAFAKDNNLSIVTSDKRIKQFYKKVLW